MSAGPPPTVGSGSVTSLPALADHPPPRQALAPRWRSIRLSAVRAARIRVRRACPLEARCGFRGPFQRADRIEWPILRDPHRSVQGRLSPGPGPCWTASAIHSRIAWRFFRHALGTWDRSNSLAVGRVDLGEVLIGLHAFLVPIGTRGRALSDEIVHHAPVDIRQ